MFFRVGFDSEFLFFFFGGGCFLPCCDYIFKLNLSPMISKKQKTKSVA